MPERPREVAITRVAARDRAGSDVETRDSDRLLGAEWGPRPHTQPPIDPLTGPAPKPQSTRRRIHRHLDHRQRRLLPTSLLATRRRGWRLRPPYRPGPTGVPEASRWLQLPIRRHRCRSIRQGRPNDRRHPLSSATRMGPPPRHDLGTTCRGAWGGAAPPVPDGSDLETSRSGQSGPAGP